jgi:hypothetical protein
MLEHQNWNIWRDTIQPTMEEKEERRKTTKKTGIILVRLTEFAFEAAVEMRRSRYCLVNIHYELLMN